MYTDVHFSSGATSHTQAQMAVAAVRVVAAPIGTSGASRIKLPTTTAFNAVRTGSSTSRILPTCRRTVSVPIPAPLPYVPAHVVYPVPIRITAYERLA